ncbi:MAG: hypothetical protein SVZ03_04265 [Spirochaetota bacterium]|nr:hypothetical protein [Spirochaetota bacterium]
MERILTIILCVSLIFSLGCFDDDEGGDTYIPAGAADLSATVNYSKYDQIDFGDTNDDGFYQGTGKLYVYLYEKKSEHMPNNYREPEHIYDGETDVNGGTIEFTDIMAGEYFVMAFYDYKGSSDFDPPSHIENNGDPYILYVGEASYTNDPDEAVAINIGGPTVIKIDLTDQYILQKKSKFDI